MSEKTYEWGRAGRLRASRDYMGLSASEMANELGMSRNSYQRMETGAAAIPTTLWDTVEEVLTGFDDTVERMVQQGLDDGPYEIVLPENASRYQRAAVARAMRRLSTRYLDVQVPDDAQARKEMRE